MEFNVLTFHKNTPSSERGGYSLSDGFRLKGGHAVNGMETCPMFLISFHRSWPTREAQLMFVERVNGIKREAGKLGDYSINT